MIHDPIEVQRIRKQQKKERVAKAGVRGLKAEEGEEHRGAKTRCVYRDQYYQHRVIEYRRRPTKRPLVAAAAWHCVQSVRTCS